MSGKGKAVLAALATISALAVVSCGKDSNTVAAPSVSAMSVAGTWSGTFASNSASCPATPMTLTIQQSGTTLTGHVEAGGRSCAPQGNVKGTISGNMVTGNINMEGCTGGGISGNVSNGVLTLAVGDFYRPLVTEQQILMQGGSATLRQ